MSSDRNQMLPSVALAIAGAILIPFTGAEWWLGLAIFVIWIASLWLILSKPPEIQQSEPKNSFSSANMAELIEYSGTPILVIEDGKVSVANRAIRKLLGKHILGQDMRVALRHPKAIKLLESNKGGFAQIRGLVRRRDVWRLNKQQLSNDIAVVEMLNETAEVDMRHAHTDFVANASHELRTPLASIIGYVETIIDEGDGLKPKDERKFLDTILAESNRMQSLVGDLMSLSRIEAEKHEQPRERIAFQTLVERSSREAAGMNREARLEFDMSGEPEIAGDARQLEQMVRNLVDNALKYGDPEKAVSISISVTENQEAMLTVADQGEGIPADQIPHLTRRFYRTDPGRSRAFGGTGLGLAIVKHIVERHRGRLDIASEVGQGTTINVRIPLAETDKPKKGSH